MNDPEEYYGMGMKPITKDDTVYYLFYEMPSKDKSSQRI